MTATAPHLTPVRFVRGIGPQRAQALAEAGIGTVADLLYYFPTGYIDLQDAAPIADLGRLAGAATPCSTIGRVGRVDLTGRPPRQRLLVTLVDGHASVHLVFFRGVQMFKRFFSQGDLLAVSGKVTRFGRSLQLVHPTVERLPAAAVEDSGVSEAPQDQASPSQPESPAPTPSSAPSGLLHTRGIVPKYGSTRGLKDVRLNVRGLRTVVRNAMDEFGAKVPERLPQEVRTRLGLLPVAEALEAIHFPPSYDRLDLARRRFKLEELLMLQLMLVLRRRLAVGGPGIAFDVKSTLARKLVDSLPFDLTSGQKSAIREIGSDMAKPSPMNRLLQGDVGSGKTIVCLTAMLIAVENGYQAALMAPTEILAVQHHATLGKLLEPTGLRPTLLLGSMKGRQKSEASGAVERGEASIVVGTHALIQESVKYRNLGLAVIDEQHRFGVSQRLALRMKAGGGVGAGGGRPLDSSGDPPGGLLPDLLVVTATPIPRTLSMTLYGDLDVSSIPDLPPGRKPVKTLIRYESERKAVEELIMKEVRAGRQAFILYPLVEESEALDLQSAVSAHARLQTAFPGIRVGLVHGRMDAGERDAVMEEFRRGETGVLVGTTVIEVGVDIPNATVMVVEHAERFGLSQLHQLRGRVGRGSGQSYAVLMAPDWMKGFLRRGASPTFSGLTGGEDADTLASVRRLEILRDTTDGYKIAENDLKMRGPGDFFGLKQSGLPTLSIADLIADADLIPVAKEEATRLVESDPHLRSDEHAALREAIVSMSDELMPLTRSG